LTLLIYLIPKKFLQIIKFRSIEHFNFQMNLAPIKPNITKPIGNFVPWTILLINYIHKICVFVNCKKIGNLLKRQYARARSWNTKLLFRNFFFLYWRSMIRLDSIIVIRTSFIQLPYNRLSSMNYNDPVNRYPMFCDIINH